MLIAGSMDSAPVVRNREAPQTAPLLCPPPAPYHDYGTVCPSAGKTANLLFMLNVWKSNTLIEKLDILISVTSAPWKKKLSVN